MKKLCILFNLSIYCFITLAQENIKKIPLLANEYWYGGIVALGNKMPYENSAVWYDLHVENFNNQTSPLLISTKGRVVWSNEPFKYQFQNRTLTIVYDKEIPQLTTHGQNLKEAFQFASKTYFPPNEKTPPSIFFSKPQYNTWIELMYNQNQKDIMTYARNILQNGFSNGVIMIDDNWQKYYGNYDFKPEKFSDAKGMIDTLHQMGFKVMVWICPYISSDSEEFRSLESKNMLVKEKNGKTAIVHWWNGYSALYDLSNTETQKYLLETLQRAQKKYGIDGFKFDGADPSYMEKNAYNFAAPTIKYNVEYSQKWAEFAENFPFNELRASWKQGGKTLVQRLGDKNYSWDAVAQLLPDMITAGLMGYPYTCPDMIGGGSFSDFLHIQADKFDQELIVRSCQIHALMPMMQFSVAPWRILNKENLHICIKAARLHEKMAPIFEKLALETSKTGLPIIRSMEMEFPNQGFEKCKDQYMIGNQILVAPMTKKGDSRSVKLPKGKWIDEQGKKYTGGKTLAIEVSLERIPYFQVIK